MLDNIITLLYNDVVKKGGNMLEVEHILSDTGTAWEIKTKKLDIEQKENVYWQMNSERKRYIIDIQDYNDKQSLVYIDHKAPIEFVKLIERYIEKYI